MHIGLTYDLKSAHLARGLDPELAAEFDSQETIDALAGTIASLGHEVEQVGGLIELTERLAEGWRCDLVFNIAEGLVGFGREAQVPALLEGYNIPCTFSDPLGLCLTLHKGVCKRMIRDLGLPTPRFAVLEHAGDADAVDLPYPLFAKPVAEGTGKGVTTTSRVNNAKELREVAAELLARFNQPVLVETYLPGREFTVSIVGTGEAARVVGVMEVVLLGTAEAGAYTFVNKEECDSRIRYHLADDATAHAAAQTSLAAHRGLGLRDASRVDLRCDEHGVPQFMEVNPLPGLHPEHSDLPITCTLASVAYRDLIAQILDSASERVTACIRPAKAA